MNDIECCGKQLKSVQDAVVDLVDTSVGLSISDLAQTDSRIDLSRFLKVKLSQAESLVQVRTRPWESVWLPVRKISIAAIIPDLRRAKDYGKYEVFTM